MDGCFGGGKVDGEIESNVFSSCFQQTTGGWWCLFSSCGAQMFHSWENCGKLVVWFVGCLVGLFVGLFVCLFVGWLVGFLIACLILFVCLFVCWFVGLLWWSSLFNEKNLQVSRSISYAEVEETPNSKNWDWMAEWYCLPEHPTMGTHVSFMFRGYNPYFGYKTFIFLGFGVQGQVVSG